MPKSKLQEQKQRATKFFTGVWDLVHAISEGAAGYVLYFNTDSLFLKAVSGIIAVHAILIAVRHFTK